MVSKQTKLAICDNSGAKTIKVFHLIKYPLSQKYSRSGDVVLGAIWSYKAHKKINKKQLCKVLITTSKKQLLRKNGNLIKFDKSCGVVLLNEKKLLGTRVFGPVSKEVRRGAHSRLLSIAKTVV